MTLKTFNISTRLADGKASDIPVVALYLWTGDPETQAAFARMADRLTEIATHDTAVLLPPEGERISLSQWLDRYRDHYAVRLERLFRAEFPDLFAIWRPRFVRRIAYDHVWPLVEASLRALCVRSLAAAWVHEKIGDAVLVGQPTHAGACWVVALGLPRYGEHLGRVTLDDEGNVVSQESSTKEEFLRIVKRAA